MGVTPSRNLEIISFTASSTQYKIGSLPISWSSCKEVSKYICENVLNLICAYFIFSTLALRIKNYVVFWIIPALWKCLHPFLLIFGCIVPSPTNKSLIQSNCWPKIAELLHIHNTPPWWTLFPKVHHQISALISWIQSWI